MIPRRKVENYRLQKEFKNKYPLCGEPIDNDKDYVLENQINQIYKEQLKNQLNKIF